MRGNSRRNDDFDFGLDEEIVQEKPIQSKHGKPAEVPKNDFFDLEEVDEQQEQRQKLPIINQKSQLPLSSDLKQAPKGNTKLQKISSKDVTYDFLDEEVDQPKPTPPVHKPDLKAPVPPKKGIAIEEPQQPEPEDQYNEDFEADAYGEDFEDFNDQPKSPEPVIKKDSKLPEKKPVDDRKIKLQASKTVTKQQSLRKNNSRASLKSEKSRRSNRKVNISLPAQNDESNKFSYQIERAFPDVDMNSLTIDNLNKLNERVRAMIRRLNDQLNQILTRNTMFLRAKKEGRSRSKGADEKLKVLIEEKKNNEKIMERMDEELKKLRHREGKLKDEDYEVDIHKRILSLTETKKQIERDIYKLKLNVSNEGKRLTSGSEKKETDIQSTFKTDLVHQKKEQFRLTDALSNVEKKLQEMQPKYADTEKKLNILLKEAANIGIDLAPKSGLKAKYDQLTKKQENQRKNQLMLDGLFKSKKEKATQQIILMKRSVQNMEAQVRNIHSEINHVIDECKNVIQKAKENPRIPKNIEGSLDVIYQSLIASDTEFDRLTEKSHQSAYSQKPILQSVGKKKSVSDHDDFLPLNPKKIAKNAQEQKQSTSPSAKPNFKKKEPTDDRNAERVWKQEHPVKDVLRDPPQLPVSSSPQVLHSEADQAKPASTDNSKPSFMLKKRNNNAGENQQPVKDINTKIDEPLIDVKPRIQQPQTQAQQQPKLSEPQKPFGNRMLRLRKGDNVNPEQKEASSSNQQSTVDLKPAQDPSSHVSPGSQKKPQLNPNQSVPQQSKAVAVDDKPMIAPRRMMLKKKEQDGDAAGGYNPTFKKENPPPQHQNPPSQHQNPPQVHKQPESHNKQVKHAVTNSYAPHQHQQSKQPTTASNPYAPRSQAHEDDNKPVRDTHRQPLQVAKGAETIAPKQETPSVPPPPANNPYNPYAPKENPSQPIREREGRLKKAKIEIGKEKFNNIYDAAEEPAANEFIPQHKPAPKIVLQDAPSNNTKSHKHEELDLNELLGIKDKRKEDAEDELLFGNKKTQDKKPIVRKRQEDFFGGFDV